MMSLSGSDSFVSQGVSIVFMAIKKIHFEKYGGTLSWDSPPPQLWGLYFHFVLF
jgi:hypothetical protein